jgi:hypothetical protein
MWQQRAHTASAPLASALLLGRSYLARSGVHCSVWTSASSPLVVPGLIFFLYCGPGAGAAIAASAPHPESIDTQSERDSRRRGEEPPLGTADEVHSTTVQVLLAGSRSPR